MCAGRRRGSHFDVCVAWAEKLATAAKVEDHYDPLGAILYRAGRYDAASQRVTAVLKSREGTAYDWLFLAMAQHRLGREQDARESVNKAADWLAKHAAPGRQPGLAWHDRLELQVLRRAAEELLKRAQP